MMLNDVHRGVEKYKKRTRVGRGPGSGHGKTSSRGHKGQKSRAGWSAHPTFQGGAMPVIRRVPKRGFHNKFALNVAIINTCDLEELFEAGDEITPEILRDRMVVKHAYDVLKVLGNGQLTKKFTVSAHRFSKSAAELIEKAGGTVVVLPGKRPIPKKGERKSNPNTKSAARAEKRN